MANEVNANIKINLDSSQALASLRNLQGKISSFNQSVVQTNAQAVAAQKNLNSTLAAQLGASRQFSTSITQVQTGVGRLQGAIDKNKLSMGEYFRYGVASSKNFGRIFKREHMEMTALATERVKRLQTQYVALGAAQNGVTKAMAVRPMHLFNADVAIGIQRQQLFNKLLTDGSTSIINWGKNTQWAGRQLMVGFTIPLTIFGAAASKVFMDLEKEAINFRKVYGDIFTTDQEVETNLEAVRELSAEMTKYGITVKDTMALAGVAAQAGLRSADLMAATTQATRLAVLGQMEQEEAMKTIISMQTAFQQSNDELAESVDFLNIIENQTVLSLQDVAGAIPRVAPVIKGMGGDVKDLAILLVAMREGGVSAAEGANALKNSLARLVDPTSKAIRVANEFGINLEGIVEKNRGEVLPTILELAQAMGTLEGVDEQKLLATIFGKFQYARIGALFKNIRDDSSQAARAIDLMGLSAEQLAETADSELSVVEEAISTKFTASMERAKLAIAPIGEIFLKIATPLLEGISKLFEKFNQLSPTVKNFITILVAGIGIAAPAIIMLVGLFGNLIGNGLKIIAVFAKFFTRLKGGGDGVKYLSGTQLDAAAAAASLEGKTISLTSSLNFQAAAVDSLAKAYQNYSLSARNAAAALPQGFSAPMGPASPMPIAMARGGLVPGSGNKDSVPALLMPGESVVTKEATQKFAPIIAAMNAGTLQGFARGMTGDVSFGSLGTVSLASIYDQASFRAIQEMADNLSNAGEDVQRVFMQILENLSETQNLTKAMVQQAASSSQIPEISSLGSQAKYSAIGAGERRSIEEQLAQDLVARANNEELISQEYARAQAAAAGAKQEIERYFDGLISNADSQEQINELRKKKAAAVQEAERIDRAHIVALTNAEKMEREAWDARLWLPQSGVENQLSNMLARSEDNRAIYESYLMNLSDSSVTEEQRLQILDKITDNIALTDTELDVQRRVLENILRDAEQSAILVEKTNGEFAKLSGAFVPYAKGAVGAARARSAMGPVDPGVEAERIVMSQQVIGGLRQDWQTASPSRVARDVAIEVPRGVGQGIREGTPEAVESAKNMAQQVTKEVNALTETSLAPSQSRGAILLGGSSQRTPNLQRYGGLQIAPASVQGRIASAALAGGAGAGGGRPPTFLGMPGMGPEGQGLANAAAQTSKALQKNTGLLNKLGTGLIKGSKGLTGMSMGLSTVAFALSRVEGPVGEMAQKAMPVIFGLSSLQMVLPLVASKFGMIAAPLIASAAAIWFFKSKADEMTKNVSNMSNALIATKKTVEKVGEFYGKESMISKQRADIIEERSGVVKEDLDQAKEFLESDVGKSMREGLAKATKEFGASTAAKQFATNLASLSLQGVMDPQQARAIAEAIGTSIGDQEFSANILGTLTKLLGPNDQNLLESPLRLAIEIDKQNAQTVEQITGNIGEVSEVFQEFLKPTKGDFAASFVPIFGQINLINKATLDWDNAIGKVARSARGILNLDDFEQQEERLKMAGNIIGNDLAQSYDNLSATKARYEQAAKDVKKAEQEEAAARKKASKGSQEAKEAQQRLTEAKEKAKRIAKEAKEAEEVLTKSIKEQESAYRDMFGAMAGAGQVVALEGMRESLSERFADDPMLKMAYDILAGKLTSSSADIQFNINMALLSGQLNPLAAQKFFDFFATDQEASQVLNLMITNSGLDATNEQLIKILNMQDDELRKEAILNIIVNQTTTGDGPAPETALSMSPEGQKVLEEREKIDQGEVKRLQGQISNLQKEKKIRESEIANLEKRKREAEEKGDFAEAQFIQNNIDRKSNELVNIEGRISETREALNTITKDLREAEKAYDASLPISQKLRGRSAARNVRTMGAAEERQAATGEFLFQKDIAKSKGIDISINYKGVSTTNLEITNKNLETFNKFPEESLKILEIDSIGDPDKLAEMTEGYEGLESKRPSVIKEAILKVMGGDQESADKAIAKLRKMGYSMEEFAKLPDNVKYNLMFNIEAEINLKADIVGLEKFVGGAQSINALERGAQKLAQARTQLAGIEEVLQGLSKLGTGNVPPGGGGSDGKGGGGGGEKSFLEQLIEDLNANAKLYLTATDATKKLIANQGKFFGVFQQLRKRGIAEEIIASLGTGPEALKKAQELLKLSKKEREKLMKQYGEVAVGQAVETKRREIAGIRQQRKATSILEEEGFSQEDAKSIASNAADALAIVTAKATMGEKAFKKFLEQYKKYLKAVEDAKTPEEKEIEKIDKEYEVLNKQNDFLSAQFEAAFGDIERSYAPIIEASQKRIKDLQKEIDLIQKEINELEERNRIDQRRIRTLERQKEMIQRQIEEQERLNELDQRRIETLRREDDIRNRVADALNHELELMSQQETKINKSYEERFKALDKISNINQHLINQQKQQLSLSQAISEGDIYAATAAAQEMRASSAEFAREQMRTGLETAQERQIAGMRTEGGLTREQAEERIRDIREQSYQASLKIRDIEDIIYDRNLKLVPLKDQIYNLDKSIRDIQDVIYGRETEILNIQLDRLAPLQSKLEKEQTFLSQQEESLENEKAAVQFGGLTYKQLQDKIQKEKEAYNLQVSQLRMTEKVNKAVGQVVDQWNSVSEAIAAANRTARKQLEIAEQAKKSSLATAQGKLAIDPNDAGAKADVEKAQSDYDTRVAQINADREAAIAAARQRGLDSMKNITVGAYAGGLIGYAMGGKIKGYGKGGKMLRYPMGGLIPYALGGSVSGDGSRDSILAKLTPGEFVIRKAMVDKYGVPMLEALNQGAFSLPRYSVPDGSATEIKGSFNTANISAPVYNTYDMKFAVNGANASADEIANKVMFKMKQVQSQGIRSNRAY